MKRAYAFLALSIALLAALALKSALLTLPAPADGTDPVRFDAHAAVERLRRVLGDERPHPVDSVAGDAVRDRLIAEMRAVGLTPRLTDDFACNSAPRGRGIGCARVRNLVATIGPPTGRHVLLVSHYDSTFAGPGAADDGIGVATMLEIAARLRGRPLRRPVTFLIDEGEQMGLIGARAFLARDPVARRVATVINLESRGVTGPAIMFETSRPNGAAIALYRAAAARPVANSLSTNLYGLIPNSTDVTVFAERPDWTILNFAIIGNETRYHSAGDTVAALDRHSVQHMGDQALAVTEQAAAAHSPAATGERLYADLAGRLLIVLPLAFGLVLLGLLLLFFLVEAKRRRAWGRPLAAMASAVIGSTALAFAGHFVVGMLRAGDFWRAYPFVTTVAVYASALAACVAALFLIARKAERATLRTAFWLFFLLVGAAISCIAPGGAIFFLLPPLLAALGMVAGRRRAWIERAAALLAALLLYLTFGPALGLFETLLSNGPFWVFAPLGALILLPALIELNPAPDNKGAALIAIGIAALGWIAAGVAPAYSEDRQQRFTVEHVRDGASRLTYDAVNNDGAPVPFDGAWQRLEVPYTTSRRWVTRLPQRGFVAPSAQVIGQAPVAGGGRRLRLRLSLNGFATIALMAPGWTDLRGAGSAGFMRRFGRSGADERYVIRCVGRACDGALIDLVIGGPQPVDFTLVGTAPGAPAAQALIRARPEFARPQYAPDSTIGVGTIRL